MANLPLNQTYSNLGKPMLAGTVIKPVAEAPVDLASRINTSPNTPSLPWQSLDPVQAAKEEALQQYTYSAGVPYGQPVFPSVDESGEPITVKSNTAIPIPSDYSGFVPAGGYKNEQEGTSGTWATPVSPVIKNYPGDVQGQYVEDTANPGALIKSNRGTNQAENRFILNSRSSGANQIDHIMPLELGGADTMANRQLLTFEQNQQKTIAQAVPYTLYAHGIISLSDARLMASSWKNRDVGGLNHPDSVGLIPLKQAQEAAAKWALPVAPTFKSTMAAIPETMKDLGKGFLPDSVRSFVRGLSSQLTLGFLPDVAEDDATGIDKAADFAGSIVGGFASFALGYGLVGRAAMATRTAGRLFTALRGSATAAAEAEGLMSTTEAIAKGVGFTMKGAQAAEVPLKARLLNALKTPAAKAPRGLPVDKPINIYKGFVSPLTEKTIRGAGQFAATSVLVGQMHQLVENQYNPYILSGQREPTSEKNLIPRIIGDAVLGGVAGVASPTLKGASLAMSPVLTIGFLEDPYHPMTALTNAAIFGAMHLVGSGAKKAEMADLKRSFEDARTNPSVVAFNYNADRAAHNYLGYWAKDKFPDLKNGEAIPPSSYTPENVTSGAKAAKDALDMRKFGDRNPDGTEASFGMSDRTYATELARLQIATTRLSRKSLPPDVQERLGWEDIISIAKSMKKGKTVSGEIPLTKSHLDDLWDKWTPRVSQDVTKWQLDNQSTINTKTANTSQITDTFGTGTGAVNNTYDAQRYMSKEQGWDTLPYVVGYLNREMAGVARQGNAWRAAHPNPDPKFVSEQDLNPENYIQLIGQKRNQETGEVRDYALGNLPGPERLQKMNEHISTEWQLPEFKSTKDNIATDADKLGVDKIFLHVDWMRSVEMAKRSKNPFVAYFTSAKSWEDTVAMNAKLSAGGAPHPYSKHIADIQNSKNSGTVSTALTVMTNKIKTDLTEPASPKELEINLNRPTMGPPVSPQEAIEIYSVKDVPEVKGNLETLAMAENSGDGRKVMAAKVNLSKTLKAVKAKYSGIEDSGVTPTTVQLDLPNSSRITNTREPSTRVPVQEQAKTDLVGTPTVEPTAGLSDRIVTNAQKELPAPIVRKKVSSTPTPVVSNESPTAIAQNYLAELRESIDNVQPPGRRYSAGDEAMVQAATKKYANIHQSVISDMETRIQNDLQGRNVPEAVINEVKQQVRSEGENHSASILGTTAEAVEGIPKPKFVAREFYKNIDEGIADKTPATHFLYRTFDTGLKSYAGPGYKKNPALPKVLGDYFSGTFFNEVNKAGKEIQQHKDVIAARASGDWNAEKAAYEARRKQLSENPTGTGGNLSDAEIQRLGLESGGEGSKEFSGMTVRPWYQEENMIGDLTRGEDLMGALFAEGPTTGAASVRAVKKLFLGTGKTGEDGLGAFILARLPGAKRASVPFAQLERDAVAADTTHSIRLKLQQEKLTEMEDLLPQLKKQSESIQKAIENPEDRANWQTPELLQENLKEIVEKMKRASKLIEETKGDGAGGPGMPRASQNRYGGSVGYSGVVKAVKGPTRPADHRLDGKGGPGDMLAAVGAGAKNLWNGGDILGGLTGTKVYNAPMDTPPAIVAPLPPSPANYTNLAPVQKAPKFPAQYSASMAEAAKHTGIPQDTMTRHFNMENSGKWDPNLIGYDPSDFGITQLNPRGVSTITGSAYKGARNYFKENYGHEFNPKDGNDQILGASVLLNHIKQFGLPTAGIKTPTLKDILISYNMGPTAYVASLARNAPPKLVAKRIRYENLLKSHGVDLSEKVVVR